jgi:hypothetical protein
MVCSGVNFKITFIVAKTKYKILLVKSNFSKCVSMSLVPERK